MSHWSKKTHYVNGWTIEPGIPGPWIIRAYSPTEGRIIRFANALTLQSAKLFAREHRAPGGRLPGEPNVHGVSATKSALSGRALTVTIEADYIPPEMVGEISEACEKIAERHCLAERLRIQRQAEAP